MSITNIIAFVVGCSFGVSDVFIGTRRSHQSSSILFLSILFLIGFCLVIFSKQITNCYNGFWKMIAGFDFSEKVVRWSSIGIGGAAIGMSFVELIFFIKG